MEHTTGSANLPTTVKDSEEGVKSSLDVSAASTAGEPRDGMTASHGGVVSGTPAAQQWKSKSRKRETEASICVSATMIDTEDPAEAQLATVIQDLWTAHGVKLKSATSAKETQGKAKDELAKVKLELAASLHTYKGRFARLGCGGQWSQFLRLQGIPRTTADSYVRRHERSIVGTANCSDGAIRQPTVADVALLVAKITPKLIPLLISDALMKHFLTQVQMAIPLSETK